MCGIVGYIGYKQATPILINALKKLEYRGYDSAGIAVFNGEDIIVRKAKGVIKVLEERICKEVIKGSMGIGHTRWATHGEPSDINAHPHTNVSGSIAVVHNGIIENYMELKKWLQAKGIVFKSQTDTEVIAHLINYFYESNLNIFEAVRQALAKIEGSYALAVECKDFPDRIVAARKESPLVVGLGENENFLASDIPALLEYTRDVYFMDQKELAVLYSDHIDLFNADGERIHKEPYHVEWDISSAEKNGFEHFMLKEIFEQPKALTDTLRPRIVKDSCGKPVDISFDEIEFGSEWKNAERIVISACGTAYHAGVVAKYAIERLVRIPVEVVTASEFRYCNPILKENDIFITISQSGETADTLAAMRLAKSKGAKIIAITNCVGSTISREADNVIYTWAGPEIAVASTKAYTTQLCCLYLIALKLSQCKEALSKDEFESLLGEMQNLPGKIEEILKDKNVIQKFASVQFNKDKIFYIGRLFDSASCLESALKLKEVSYMHSEAFNAGELKHGPIALIDSSTLVVAIATQPDLYDKIGSNVVEVKTRGASTFVITQDKSDSFRGKADEQFILPEVSPVLSSIIAVIPAQLFAYYCSILRGNNPDQPRNLAKSVTVE